MLPSLSFNALAGLVDGGDPCPCADPGYLRLTIPFTDYDQQSIIDFSFTTPQDWSGQILYMRYRLVSGFVSDPAHPGGVVLAVKTGAQYIYGASSYTNQPTSVPGGGAPWGEIDFDLSKPYPPVPETGPAFDPSMVVAIEMQFATGGSSGVASLPPTAAVFDIDMIGIKHSN